MSTVNIADELDSAMRNYGTSGISQAELARISGVPQPTISRTLMGASVPETKTLIRLADALKCTLGGYVGTGLSINQPTSTYSLELSREESTILRAFRLAAPEVRISWLNMADGILERLNTPSQLVGNGPPNPD